MGSTVTCCLMGVVKKALGPCRNAGAPRFRLGLGQSEYVQCDPGDSLVQFLAACREQNGMWQAVLEEKDLQEAVHRVHATVYQLAQQSGGAVQALSRDGYVRLSLVRKLFLGWVIHRHSFQPQRWEAVKSTLMGEMGPDEGKYLSAFPSSWSVAEVSTFMFGRADWGIFVSMFGCLWHDVVRGHTSKELSTLADTVSSPEFRDRVRALTAAAGHTLCPASVLAQMCAP